MRRPSKRSGIDTDLIIGDSISNIIHKFRHDLNIVVVFRVPHRLNTAQYPSELVLDLIEGARRGSAYD